MNIGPIQLVVIGFDRTDRFKGEIMKELEMLRTGGAIRVLDLIFVMKDEDGDIIAFEDSDLTQEEEAEYGALIGGMLGLGAAGVEGAAASIEAEVLAATENGYGLTVTDIQDIAAQIEPGTAAGILLIEHKWAVGFKHAVQEAGGRMLAQGFLTPEALLMVGQELQAIVEAEAVIEIAEAVKGAAILDALITVAQAEEIKEAAIEEALEVVVEAEIIKSIAAAEAVRALIVAGMIEDAAAQEALEVLVAAELIEAATLQEATDAVAEAHAIAAEAFAAAEQASGDEEVAEST